VQSPEFKPQYHQKKKKCEHLWVGQGKLQEIQWEKQPLRASSPSLFGPGAQGGGGYMLFQCIQVNFSTLLLAY
jgi:hypothetical protein